MIGVQLPAIPESALGAVLKELRSFGASHLETGGFFLLPRGGQTVSTVALAGDSGIVRGRNLFQISERALARLFDYADGQDLWAPIQFHSHARDAFLSLTDAAHGLRVEGFVSVVVPHYAEPTADMKVWGWWCFSACEWLPIEPAITGSGGVTVIRFDEDGARDA
jgi:hypothetical protein